MSFFWASDSEQTTWHPSCMNMGSFLIFFGFLAAFEKTGPDASWGQLPFPPRSILYSSFLLALEYQESLDGIPVGNRVTFLCLLSTVEHPKECYATIYHISWYDVYHKNDLILRILGQNSWQMNCMWNSTVKRRITNNTSFLGIQALELSNFVGKCIIAPQHHCLDATAPAQRIAREISTKDTQTFRETFHSVNLSQWIHFFFLTEKQYLDWKKIHIMKHPWKFTWFGSHKLASNDLDRLVWDDLFCVPKGRVVLQRSLHPRCLVCNTWWYERSRPHLNLYRPRVEINHFMSTTRRLDDDSMICQFVNLTKHF